MIEKNFNGIAFGAGTVIGIGVGALVGYFIGNVKLGIGFGLIGGAFLSVIVISIAAKKKK